MILYGDKSGIMKRDHIYVDVLTLIFSAVIKYLDRSNPGIPIILEDVIYIVSDQSTLLSGL